MYKIILATLNKISFLKTLKKEEKEKIAEKICESIEYEIFNKKMLAEITKIDHDKWVEGTKINSDPGQDYIKQWIKEHGKDFDEEFSKSDCQTCLNVYENCTKVPQFTCDKYSPDLLKQSKHIIKKIFELLNEEKVINETNNAVVDNILKHYGLL